MNGRVGLRSPTQAHDHDLPLVDVLRLEPDAAALAELPPQLRERMTALPFGLRDGELDVAIADPFDLAVLDELRAATELRVRFAVAPRADIQSRLGSVAAERATADRRQEVPVVREIADAGEATPFIESMIVRAAGERASDVHLLPQADGLLVRFRIDGVLKDVSEIPRERAAAVIARIKVLARLDIAEHRRPQDGRFAFQGSGKTLDIRAAVVPGVEGEAAVLRLLDKSRVAPTLTEIGLPFPMQMALEQVIGRSTGALLVTGPTGSGKSTTVYAALADLARPEIHVVTVEDPVEYRLPAIFQMQVNKKIGVTFATALRSLLRADPDVVMVGEIRDGETAQVATESALTGHFVLSTLHTNDAPTTLTRLIEMGVEPYVVSSAVSAVVAQRLVRRLCEQCREAYEPPVSDLQKLGLPAETKVLYRARGCAACSRGFRGRIGIFQLLLMSDELRAAIARSASQDEFTAIATREGMHSLWHDGLDKLAAGVTTVEELRRVLN